MPYPNEHACRLRAPGDFEKDSLRRTTRESDGQEYSVIMGRLEGKDTMTEQAYRYDKDEWTEKDARAHCTDHDGISFEPATNPPKEKTTKVDAIIRPLKGKTQSSPRVRTGGQGGGRHQVAVGKTEAHILVSGYVVRRSDGRLVVRDSHVNADAHGVVEAIEGLLGADKMEGVEFNPEAQGSPLFDLAELDDTFYLAPAEEPTEVTFELGVVEKAADKRYTFGVVYQAGVDDAHDEYATADDLQKAQWAYVQRGNRSIYNQHGPAADVIGELVDIVAWPFEVEVEFEHKGEVEKRTIPAGSVWAGVIWSEEAWPSVKDGTIGGLSMGGWAKRKPA